jgi:hypothetical protein
LFRDKKKDIEKTDGGSSVALLIPIGLKKVEKDKK